MYISRLQLHLCHCCVPIEKVREPQKEERKRSKSRKKERKKIMMKMHGPYFKVQVHLGCHNQ